MSSDDYISNKEMDLMVERSEQHTQEMLDLHYNPARKKEKDLYDASCAVNKFNRQLPVDSQIGFYMENGKENFITVTKEASIAYIDHETLQTSFEGCELNLENGEYQDKKYILGIDQSNITIEGYKLVSEL
jgi:hypothetical protein